jgi:hypothetical protein
VLRYSEGRRLERLTARWISVSATPPWTGFSSTPGGDQERPRKELHGSGAASQKSLLPRLAPSPRLAREVIVGAGKTPVAQVAPDAVQDHSQEPSLGMATI